MPRLLLITYSFPPREQPGAIRPGGLAKHLAEFGWDVVVFTPQLPAGAQPPVQVIETAYEDVLAKWKSRLGMDPGKSVHEQLKLRTPSQPNSGALHTKILSYARCFLSFPDEARGWIPFATRELEKLRATGDIDAILTTSPPVSTHLIGKRAQRLLNRPWVADFRDLWAEQYLWGPHLVMQPMHRLLEKRTLRLADVLVTVSEPWAQRLREHHPTKPVYNISNGFDPDDFRDVRVPLSKKFSITHAGYLYEGKRDPTTLLQVLRELIAERAVQASDLQVRFYGHPEAWVSHLVERYGLQDVVELSGVIPRREVLQREAESQVLLLLGWADPRETGQHTGKLFEYFGAGRPILAVNGTRGVLTETLAETKAGIHVFDKEQLRGWLLKAYHEFKRAGAVPYQPDQRAVARYTHREMARRFSEVLQSTLERSRGGERLRPQAEEGVPQNYGGPLEENVQA